MTEILSRFNKDYFFTVPAETQIIWFWLGAFVLFLIATISVYIWLGAKGRQVKPYRHFAKNFFWPNLTFAILGLFFIFSRYEGLSFFSWRFWIYFILLAIVTYNAWYFMLQRNKLEGELLKFYNTERKTKWIDKSKSKKSH